MTQADKKILTESESKTLLKKYGLPVVEEIVALTEDETAAAAAQIGYPVVVKGQGSKLAHKTEQGAVKLNLHSAKEVRKACREIKKSAADNLESYLVQPFIEGKREFTAGLIRDAQFGPAVMFGLGGIYTEALQDVAFRIAPVDRYQAEQMLEEVMSRKLLSSFRGEAAADREQLIRVILGLSQLAIENPDIKEVDINPLLISLDGRVTAVDALVVFDPEGPVELPGRTPDETLTIRQAIKTMTHPKSVAVIGATPVRLHRFPGMYFCMKNFGYPGRLYPVNPNIEEIDGVKAYPNLAALPEPVDFVIISVPAQLVPDALRDCAATGNKQVHIFTAGFKEAGEEEGILLQQEMETIAREGGLHVVGPNGMGLYVPSSGVLCWRSASKIGGPIGFISQSGGYAQDFSQFASTKPGINFSMIVSYGNALTLDSTDFLDYLGQDEETKIITMYVEGVKNGQKLLRQVSEINRTKPVIIFKGGMTETGARTVASHTGSMAGGEKIWKAFFRQTGAVRVDTLDEMGDVTLAFRHLPEAPGRRVVVIGTGGGAGVAAADSSARAGLIMPTLPPEVTERLREFIPAAGNIIRNPIDAHLTYVDLALLERTLKILSPEYIDMFVFALPIDWLYPLHQGAQLEKIVKFLGDARETLTKGRPVVVSWRQYRPDPPHVEARAWLQESLLKVGIPAYEGFPRTFKALGKLADYSEWKRNSR